jgi:hypothetical protein
VSRTILTLLLIVPYLFPPGFCICRLETFALRAARPAARPDPAESPRCPCCRRCEAAPRWVEQTLRAALPERAPDRSHLPGCPANPARAVTRAASPPAAAAVDVAIAAVPCDAGAPAPVTALLADAAAPAVAFRAEALCARLRC